MVDNSIHTGTLQECVDLVLCVLIAFLSLFYKGIMYRIVGMLGGDNVWRN